MSLASFACKRVRLPAIGSLSLVGCALILLVPAPAWPDEFVQTNVSSPAGNQTCKSSTPPASCSSALPGANASAMASYGTVGGQATASSVLGFSAEASAQTQFSDNFSFLNASGEPTTFTVGFDTTGGSVSGAANPGEFAELQVKMTLRDTSVSQNTAFAEYVLDTEGGVNENSGLPLNVLTLVVPEGQSVSLSLQAFLDAGASNGDSASVVDPTGVFVSSTSPYTATSGTIYPTSFNSTPEPGSLLLFGSGLASLVAWRRKTLSRT